LSCHIQNIAIQFTVYCVIPCHNDMLIQVFNKMDIGRTVRKAMKKFADAIDDVQDRLSHDQIIHACSVSEPSVIGIHFLFSLLVEVCMCYKCKFNMCLLYSI